MGRGLGREAWRAGGGVGFATAGLAPDDGP